MSYVLWGVLVLFWAMLKSAGAWELLAHRIVWSFVFVVVCLLVLRRPWTWVRLARSLWPRLVLAAVLVAANWVTFIWAVNSNHVAETSLGYFLNPLLNVVLGAIFFRERPTPASLLGIGVAAVGVGVIGVAMTKTVWVALTLAATFGAYGVVKKRSPLGSLEGLAVESGLLAPLALAYLLWLGPGGTWGTTPTLTALLVASGPVTALPLWLFAIAAPRIPLGLLGMLQFVAPSITLILGVTVLGQTVPTLYWVGMGFVWAGLALYLGSVLRRKAPVPGPPK